MEFNKLKAKEKEPITIKININKDKMKIIFIKIRSIIKCFKISPRFQTTIKDKSMVHIPPMSQWTLWGIVSQITT